MKVKVIFVRSRPTIRTAACRLLDIVCRMGDTSSVFHSAGKEGPVATCWEQLSCGIPHEVQVRNVLKVQMKC